MWRRPWVQDVGLASALVVSCALLNDPQTPAIWWAATIMAGVGVALRRVAPLPMLALCAVAAGMHLASDAPFVIVDLAAPILLYTVADRYRRAVSLSCLGALLLLGVAWSLAASADGEFMWQGDVSIGPMHVLPERPKPPGIVIIDRRTTFSITSGISVLGSTLVAAWAVGSSARGRRRYLERERDRQAELAATAERARISRELHDVVAHGLSVMVVQAQGGAAALDNRPADTRAALQAIVQTGRKSLADMRQVLGAVAREPQPGLADVPRLAAHVTDAGVPVEVVVEGRAGVLPSTVDLSGYRIIQEALTNTMKHAGPGAQARVHITYTDRELRLRVSDDGGAGLRGMRERAAMLGGEVTAGPTAEGGFEVDARLPLK
jgi:signal transduction histidine kinase